MSCQVAGDSHKNVPALRRVIPFPELPDPRFQHLVGVEACVFPEKRPGEGSDHILRWVPEREVTLAS